MGKIEWYLTMEKIHLLSTRCIVEKENKKIPDFLPFFKLYLYFQDFFQVRKIALQISRHFQEFKTKCTNPVYIHWWFPGLKHLLYN